MLVDMSSFLLDNPIKRIKRKNIFCDKKSSQISIICELYRANTGAAGRTVDKNAEKNDRKNGGSVILILHIPGIESRQRIHVFPLCLRAGMDIAV